VIETVGGVVSGVIFATLTETRDESFVSPAVSVAFADMAWLPLLIGVVESWALYGLVVSVENGVVESSR